MIIITQYGLLFRKLVYTVQNRKQQWIKWPKKGRKIKINSAKVKTTAINFRPILLCSLPVLSTRSAKWRGGWKTEPQFLRISIKKSALDLHPISNGGMQDASCSAATAQPILIMKNKTLKSEIDINKKMLILGAVKELATLFGKVVVLIISWWCFYAYKNPSQPTLSVFRAQWIKWDSTHTLHCRNWK